MNTNSKTGPGVREDHRTGQFVPTVDGKDVSPTSFDRDRAMTIAQGHWLTKSQAQPAPAQTQAPKVAHTPTPWTLLDPWTTGDTVKQQLVSQGRGAMMLQHDGTTEGRANAAFIVQAVNSHAKLLALAEDLEATCDEWCLHRDPTLEEIAGLREQAKAALALAGKEQV